MELEKTPAVKELWKKLVWLSDFLADLDCLLEKS